MSDNEGPPTSPGRAFPLRRWQAIGLVALVSLLYAAGVNNYWRFQRDSVLYMGLARSLAEGTGYTFNDRPHRLVWPGFPLVLATVYRTAGQNFLPMNALVSAFGVGVVILSGLLFARLGLTPVQAGSAWLLVACSRTLYYYSAHIMPTVPFVFFVLVGLYSGTRMVQAQGPRAWAWCAAASGAACAATLLWPMGPALLVALLAGVWLRPRPPARRVRLGQSAILVLPVAVLAGLWAYRCAVVDSPHEMTYYGMFIADRGGWPGVAGSVTAAAPRLVVELPDTLLGVGLGWPVGALLAAIAGLGAVNALRGGERVLSVYGLAHLAGICIGSPGRRYLLAAAPVLIYWLVLGAASVGALLARPRGATAPRWASRVGYALLALALLVNLGRVSKVLYECRAPGFYARTEEGRLPAYFRLSEWLARVANRRQAALAYEDRLLHYLSRARVEHLGSDAMGVSADDAAGFLERAQVRYIVQDPRKERDLGALDDLRSGCPWAFEEVRRFGSLVVIRVRPGLIREVCR